MTNFMDETMFLICIGAFGLVLLCLIAFITIKERESNKRANRFSSAIEVLGKEIYKIQKENINLKEKIHSMEFAGDANAANNEQIQAITKAIRRIENDLESSLTRNSEKLISLENKIKEYSGFSTSGSGGDLDEKKIIDMFQNGFSIDSIAKEMRIGRGEVEFTLKLANLR